MGHGFVCFRAAAALSGLAQAWCARCVISSLPEHKCHGAHLGRVGIWQGQNVPPICRRRCGSQNVGLSNIGHIYKTAQKEVTRALNDTLQAQRQLGSSGWDIIKHDLVSCA